MINLSYLPISMLYPKTGEYKQGFIPPFLVHFIATGETKQQTLNESGENASLNAVCNIIIH